MKNNLLALVGAIVGGAVGYFAFFWIEADRPAVADADNSMRVIHEIADSLKSWDPAGLKLPDGEDFWNEEPTPANRQLDDERTAVSAQHRPNPVATGA